MQAPTQSAASPQAVCAVPTRAVGLQDFSPPQFSPESGSEGALAHSALFRGLVWSAVALDTPEWADRAEGTDAGKTVLSACPGVF